MTSTLSKSRFQYGLQCMKRLYLESYRRELADPVDPGRQAIFDSGTAVGELARQRFLRGILVHESHLDHQQSVETTRALVDDSSVPSIYEAGFTFEGIRTRIDVLERNEGGAFNLIEVKSTASVKPEHYTDVAIQLYVVEGSGIPVNRAFLMHLNRDYVYQGGELNLQQLFALEDVTAAARSFVDNAAVNKLNEMWSVLEMEEEPDIGVGTHCNKPHRCSFFEHCHRDLMVDYGRPHVNDGLASALSEIRLPAAFLDFEAANPAIPVFAGTRPYQMIPFQWSLHTMDQAGNVGHQWFLNDDSADPRERVATSLLEALPPEGSIVTYSPFERAVVNGLSLALPKYADTLQALCDRMVDLLGIVRANVRHPDFRGSYSIKSVLPALVPETGYEGLEIAEGLAASASYARMVNSDTPGAEKADIREALLTYCARDTEAMVRVYEALVQLSQVESNAKSKSD